MPRAHTEFLRSGSLPWVAAPGGWARADCETRLLSQDAASGACSLLLKYPPGWSGSVCLACDEEQFVLSGDLWVGATKYSAGDYAYWPARCARGAMGTRRGCTVLTFFEGVVAPTVPADYDESELIEKVSTSAMAWAPPSDATLAAGRVGRKVLKPSERSGGRTWLLKIEADGSNPFEISGVERHPCVEEMFLLEGDMAMTCGTMRKGDYFWRPPMIPHGPMGTRDGFLGFFRAKEGAFDTEWSVTEEAIPWDAPYSPTLPDELPVPR